VALALGTRLGSYEIIALLGTGGMGEVYRARDTTLHRDVALKILPDTLAADPDRVARFRREARVLAALNHPHIAAIYGVEDSGSVHALVLELVEGPTLADRIVTGPIPLDDALPIAKQVAEALEAAHELGIIHRDLKPANITVRDDGTVKVLDFGLAKALEPESALSASLTNSPTISTPVQTTGMGTMLGTPAYMSPEQTKGRPADKRSDVWAFGCVLYEMLTAHRAFNGDHVSDILASVLKDEPDWSSLPADTPAAIRRLLRRSLQKDRSERLPDVGGARMDIADVLDADEPTDTAPAPFVRRWLPWGLAATFAAALALAVWAPWRMAPRPGLRGPTRVEANLGLDGTLAMYTFGGNAMALSPDGTMLAFVAYTPQQPTPQLFLRRLDQLQATALAGTDGADTPFFSPDGQWIAFWASGTLRKISTSGGAAIVLCDQEVPLGGTWVDNDTIVFSQRGQLLQVSGARGTAHPLPTAMPNELQIWPQILPGGKDVLFTATTSPGASSTANVVVDRLSGGGRHIVARGATFGRYVDSGHVLYVQDGVLFAAPFDVSGLSTTGGAVSVVESVTWNYLTGGAQFASSSSGTFVFAPGGGSSPYPTVSLLDRSGKTAPLTSLPRRWGTPRFSPDGQRLALTIAGESSNADIWTYDLARDLLHRISTSPATNIFPVWTSNGQRIVYGSNRDRAGSPVNLYWQPADGTGEAQRLTWSDQSQLPDSWHPTQNLLAFHQGARAPQRIMLLKVDGDESTGWHPKEPTVLIEGPFRNNGAAFSPDGRWLAYASDKSGLFEIYVRPFPGPGQETQVSNGGGLDPVWSPTHHELFYNTNSSTPRAQGSLQIMVVPYTIQAQYFRPEKARPWPGSSPMSMPPVGQYAQWAALRPDGDRFAVATPPQPEAPGKQSSNPVVFVFNFFEELRRRAPSR
jgi:serine/threonine-protein kinase